jgi:hypothetical protein
MAVRESESLDVPSITTEQILTAVLAIPAFLPSLVCSGYVVAWATNLHRFRERTLVERVFWSVPLSLALSTSAIVLLGRLSLNAAVLFLWAGAALCLGSVFLEQMQLRQQGKRLAIGLRPLGGIALVCALLWTVVTVLSLVDIESNRHLFMSVPMLDQAYRVNWTESVLRTGIPPANSLYWAGHSAPMRNYYFWYALCAVVAKMAHLPVRAVITASCVWAGFVLAALNGLCLKHLVEAGPRLRKQFLCSIGLLAVTGLDICVIIWNTFFAHLPLSSYPEDWSKSPIVSWLVTLLWAPHHIASLGCCIFALLLAWMGRKEPLQFSYASAILIGFALASAFGLSIYVTFAFFLVMLPWAMWQGTIEGSRRPVVLLAEGGAVAAVLLIPYLWELTHGTAGTAGAGSTFEFAVREMIPVDSVMRSGFFQRSASIQYVFSRTFGKLLLLAPGYALELGFYLVVFLIYSLPFLRSRKRLTPAERTLLLIAVLTVPLVSVLRSSVIAVNDFGIRSALLLQFPLLLLGSVLIADWKMQKDLSIPLTDPAGASHPTPGWVRKIAKFALLLGVCGTIYQTLVFRFAIPVVTAQSAAHDPKAGDLSHNAYISEIGYAEMNAAVPGDAIVQYNPAAPTIYWESADLVGVNHQTAMSTDRGSCGAELGGNPGGCREMAASVDTLFKSASAETALKTCRQYGIQFLIARIYDPIWSERHSWVWTLKPVVTDEEFRVLNCNSE